MKTALLTLMLILQGAPVAMAQTPESQKPAQIDTLSVGSTTRAWLEEQGTETNRATTEPFSAQRAAQSVIKYLSGADTPSASSANNSFKASPNATGSSR